MINITLKLLSLSLLSKSPQLLIPYSKQTRHFIMHQTVLSRFTDSSLKTYSNNHETIIKNTIFQHFLSTPLVFVSIPEVRDDVKC